MILGIGSDIIDIRRIEALCQRFGRKFEERVFTPQEIGFADRRGQSGMKARHSALAKRFAAKEACAKALATGIGRVSFLHIEVCNTTSGKPEVHLSGHAKMQLESLIPSGMVAKVDVSLADDYPMAQAFVVISAHPR